MSDVTRCISRRNLALSLSLAAMIVATRAAFATIEPRDAAPVDETEETAVETAAEPTTRPTKPAPAWAATLDAFASALNEGTTRNVDPIFAQLVPADASVREFNRTQRSTLTTLREKSAGHTLLASRAYSSTPNTLAGDLAADVRDAKLPAMTKRRLTPADPPDLRRANSVAAKWITNSLMTSGNDPIGVIVLWQKEAASAAIDNAEPTDDDAPAAERDTNASIDPAVEADAVAVPKPRAVRQVPLFILVRGELVDGKYVIRQICYGNPIILAGGG